MSKPRCACGRAAAFLCDAPVPITAARRVEALRSGEPPSGTCDRPFCARCRTRVGSMFFCGRRPAAGVESVDHCPEHAGRDPAPPEPRTRAGRIEASAAWRPHDLAPTLGEQHPAWFAHLRACDHCARWWLTGPETEPCPAGRSLSPLAGAEAPRA